MGVGNIFLLTQVTLYFLNLLLSFFILIPIAVNKQQFSGHCLLYSSGEWKNDNKTGEEELNVKWGEVGYCNFPIFISVLMLPLSFFYLVNLSIHLYKNTESSWAATFAAVITCWLVSLLTLTSGIIVTDGFNKWCDLLGKGAISCEMGEFAFFEIETDINKDGYWVQYGVAKFGLWCSWICWTVVAIMTSYRLYGFHQREDFLISMRRERERLIQRVSNSNSREALYT